MSHAVADRAHGPHIHHSQACQLKTRPTPALIMGTTSMIDRRRIAHAAYEAQAAGLHQTRTGRRTRLKIERHTQGYPLSVPFNRHLMGRSQSAVDGAGGSRGAFFNTFIRQVSTLRLQLAGRGPVALAAARVGSTCVRERAAPAGDPREALASTAASVSQSCQASPSARPLGVAREARAPDPYP